MKSSRIFPAYYIDFHLKGKHLQSRTRNQQFSKGAMVQVQLIIGSRMTTMYYKINYIGNYGAVISMRGVIHLLTDHRNGNYRKITKVSMQEVGSSDSSEELCYLPHRKLKHYNNGCW